MKRFLFFLLILGIFGLAFCAKQEAPPPQEARSPVLSPVEKQNNVPQKARDVLRHIRETGKPPEGYVGGRVWQNRERNLPLEGHYREYDINPKIKGKNRGPQRLVIDKDSGKAWYTPDHYRTFILIQ